MPLTSFGLDRNETEAMLAAWEEDYQLHRHLELIPADLASPVREEPQQGGAPAAYFVGGVGYTDVVIRASIRGVMG
jgi:hypothetical protein